MNDSTLNLKKENSWFKKRSLVVMMVATILTTLGIKASDRFFTASVKDAVEFEQCPPEMVFITSEEGGFCIDKYENSAGADCPNRNPKNQTETRVNLNKFACKPESAASIIPWVNISQNQAALACAKLGKRLPTNKEWYQAALGTIDINSGWKEGDCHLDNNWNDQPGETGSAQNCVSPAGIFDMVGNIWEWTSETIVDGEYDGRKLPQQGFVLGVDENGLPTQTDLSNPSLDYNNDYFWIQHQGVRVIARGGSWNSEADGGVYSSYLAALPSNGAPGTGFRCVK